MTRTLLIIDDHASFRSFVRGMLSADGFEVTGEAGDGETGLEEVERLKPEVVLLDVQMPGIDGFEVARRLGERPDPPKVILTSSRSSSEYGDRLRNAPVLGFIPKQEISGADIEALLGDD